MPKEFFLDRFIKEVVSLYGKDRVVDFLFYGSGATNKNTTQDSDLDFYLLLDLPHDDDLIKLRACLQSYNIVDISLQYKSIIEVKGVKNFQHGNHGTFFFKYLATAQSIIGNNYFLNKLNFLDKHKEEQSLLFQIEEYFWRLNKSYLYSSDDKWKIFFRKYIMRICIDMMLIENNISYSDINMYSHLEIIEKYIAKSQIFSSKIKKLLFIQYSDIKSNHWLEIKTELYFNYLQLYKNKRLRF